MNDTTADLEQRARRLLQSLAGYEISRWDVQDNCSVLAKDAIAAMLTFRDAERVAEGAGDEGPCTDCNDTGWFYGDPDLGPCGRGETAGCVLRSLLVEGIQPMATAERFNWSQRVRDALSVANGEGER